MSSLSRRACYKSVASFPFLPCLRTPPKIAQFLTFLAFFSSDVDPSATLLRFVHRLSAFVTIVRGHLDFFLFRVGENEERGSFKKIF